MALDVNFFASAVQTIVDFQPTHAGSRKNLPDATVLCVTSANSISASGFAMKEVETESQEISTRTSSTTSSLKINGAHPNSSGTKDDLMKDVDQICTQGDIECQFLSDTPLGSTTDRVDQCCDKTHFLDGPCVDADMKEECRQDSVFAGNVESIVPNTGNVDRAPCTRILASGE